MDVHKIDTLNIGLVILSLILAVFMPFKLFLFSYAILGPLHYLTEIQWLNKKDYFISDKRNWVWLYVLLAFVISIVLLISLPSPAIKSFLSRLNLSFLQSKNIASPVNAFIVIGFVFAIGLLFVKKIQHVLILLLMSIVSVLSANKFISETIIFFGVFLPTLIHVYVFTFFFIIFGAIKSNSKFAWVNGLILLCIPFVIYFIPIIPSAYSPSQSTLDTFISTKFANVGAMVAKFTEGFVYRTNYLETEIGLKIQIFIAFAYTYHYLNWFSKTSIIGWKKSMSKRTFYFILMLWMISMGIYFYDYRTGLLALLFLSYTHVFLEFPLNAISIKEVFLFIKKGMVKLVSN